MKKMIALISAVLTAAALFASCVAIPKNPSPASSGTAETKAGTAAEKPAVPGPSELDNRLEVFDFDLMNYVEQRLGDESYMISPLSFKYALGMLLAGFGCVLLGGCPLRQLVLSGEGNTDSAVAVLGLLTGAAFCHNFGLASSGKGPTANGKTAVILGLAVALCIAFSNTFRKDN